MNSIKTVNSQQAKYIHHYKNIKGNLYKTNASIWKLWPIVCKKNIILTLVHLFIFTVRVFSIALRLDIMGLGTTALWGASWSVAAGHQICYSDEIKMGGACSMYGEGINAYRVSVGYMEIWKP